MPVVVEVVDKAVGAADIMAAAEAPVLAAGAGVAPRWLMALRSYAPPGAVVVGPPGAVVPHALVLAAPRVAVLVLMAAWVKAALPAAAILAAAMAPRAVLLAAILVAVAAAMALAAAII